MKKPNKRQAREHRKLERMFATFMDEFTGALETGRDFDMPMPLMMLTIMRVFYQILKETGRSDEEIRDLMFTSLTVALKCSQDVDAQREYAQLMEM